MTTSDNPPPGNQGQSPNETNPFVQALLREQRRAEERAFLYQMALDLISRSGTSVITTTEIALDSMFGLLDCHRAAILLPDDDSGSLEVVASRGTIEWIRPTIYQPFLATRQALILKDSSEASYIGIGLRVSEEWLGLMLAQRDPSAPPFSESEVQLITLLASVTAAVLLNNRLRQSLQERLELNQAVMESSLTGMAVVELRSQRLLIANPSTLRILQLTEKAIERPMNIDGPDGLLAERMAEALLSETGPTFEYHLMRNGRDRYLRIDVVPLGSDKLIAQISDITLLREIDSRWENAVASASHDLKTPLTVVSLGLSTLRDYYEDTTDAERQAFLGEALEQVEAMKGLLSDLIRHATNPQLARVPSDPANECTTDPAFYVEEVAAELAPFAKHFGVYLNAEIPASGDVTVRGTPSAIKTIVRNLLNNAIKYTPMGHDVWISTALSIDRTMFAISVRDDGVGIPPEELNAIFERGYRASTGATQEGSGLGLSFVRDLVNQAEGVIYVNSTVDVGSTFQVVLPCIDPPSSDMA